jgi:hypothetical protein
MRSRACATLLALALAVPGCCAASVRQLTRGEEEYMAAVSKRVEENRAALEQLMADLASIERQYAFTELQNATTAIAQQKLLEAMRSPWAAPASSLQSTQRAAALFHLYELADQQKARFDAEQSERATERQKVLDAYATISRLMAEVLTNERVVLEYVNQPRSSQIAALFEETLEKAHAFGDELGKSTDPRLEALAKETEKATERVDRAKAAIETALNNLNSVKK